MAGPTVTLAFAGDSTSLEKTFAKVGTGAKNMAADFDKAETKTKSFGGAVDTMNDKVGNSESRFMASADLLDGLGGAFGLPLEGATNMARSFADLASGLSGIVGPAIAKVAGMFGIQTAATTAQATATGAATGAQWSLNAALSANPIGAVVIAIAALVGGFVLAWKHSETFRDIVRGALNIVKDAAEGLWNFFKDLPGRISGIGRGLVDVITWPYRTAFNLVSDFWNRTIGSVGFKVPDWVPGVGGKGWDFPDMPHFHAGGVIPGTPGTPTPVLALAGERIVTDAQASAGAGPTTIVLQVDGRELARVVTDHQRGNAARGFR